MYNNSLMQPNIRDDIKGEKEIASPLIRGFGSLRQ